MVVRQPSKLDTRVRFPSLALKVKEVFFTKNGTSVCAVECFWVISQRRDTIVGALKV